jgi:hypothetical protein
MLLYYPKCHRQSWLEINRNRKLRMKLIATHFKEEASGRATAEIYEASNGFSIRYIDPAGQVLATETHPGKSLQWVEDAAENWALGIKLLNE